ncbi:UDP-N-acetylmuramate:L-alanyl-gamma-D-glutamyl-meso-diaminopimelate ligase [Motiliproteus sp. MSK22-1]|uniref:UDP-N-acetylmuramate:L-alanyl-gamma-D-glutamyl- meso-diaminopimelate ligase n=1 Tax=Motiliproteus sp. MSK22-1 TaxID=1897630 RepID=UPI000976717F|nr:UDP-N-acetylmuramate:L-alanyl-gamma-D-glutamyl-meso-diaminopimelate ligase [Motiliproteus sp. MSK22-1]OMH30235.1 UDP-N-acetylmuramate:L-alanyl-gamma-D-glutamyl-meso-diaminopimelate ligase [Motiliproteus sp. MSK22-1]
MHLHILGICGTFMGSLALLAKARGFKVTGSDANVYPPMSTLLESQGIDIAQGFEVQHLQPEPDLVIIGNAMSRGNPCVEYVLNKGLDYCSGPEWLARHVLKDKWVLAVAGTHGKTSTSSMLAWILEDAGMSPGFLIGGVPNNFGLSARLGDTPFFVVEADEYDTAFFDKRSKFVHYHPRTAILNNLEFDHADIFDDLAAIERQFHHLVRTIPESGQIIMPASDQNLTRVLRQGAWTPVVSFDVESKKHVDADSDVRSDLSKDNSDHENQAHWQAKLLSDDGSCFELWRQGERVATVDWSQTGIHSVMNGLAAIIAAQHVGVLPVSAAEALGRFQGVKRRMEVVGEAAGLTLYDDFAHHPTAIESTLKGLRARVGDAPILAVIEPRSNTMRLGAHSDKLAPATAAATEVIWYQPEGLDWNMEAVSAQTTVASQVHSSIDSIIESVKAYSGSGGHVLIMSNGGFGGIHAKLLKALQELEQN